MSPREDDISPAVTVFIAGDLLSLRGNESSHINIYGAIVDFEKDAWSISPGFVGNLRIRHAIQHTPILEDRTDIHFGLVRNAVQRCPCHFGRGREVLNTKVWRRPPAILVTRR